MIVETLNVTLADLMPLKGVAVTLPGESIPYRISERLHAALKDEAIKQGVMMSALFKSLRDELNPTL